MFNVRCVFWFTTLIFTASLVDARPRNSRQTGTPTSSCESRKHLTALQGTVASPGFPGTYPANSSCTWIITPPQTANLSLTFMIFNIPSNSKQCGGKKCRCDFVQVKELDPPQDVAGFNTKFCNDNPPNMIYNVMSRVRIRFVSDAANEGTGFSLNYNSPHSPTTAPPPIFDSTGVLAKAALRAGIGGRAGISVNQTVTTTTSTTSKIKNRPTQPPTNSSVVSIPLSEFTSKAPMNLSATTDAVVQLTSETPTTQGINGSVVILPSSEHVGPTVMPRTFPVTGGETSGNIWTSSPHVVMVKEETKVEEEVPDIIILGPSVPVVLIFVLVVAGIAWWNYKFSSEELNRYESYAKSNKAKKRQKRNMKNISKGNLYNKMTKDWRGQSFSVTSTSSPMAGRKISFAGRLLELAEGVRTPRPSRPPSEETVPLNKPAAGTASFLTPEAASPGGGSRPSSRPSSRPASQLLRDALVNMFGGTDDGDAQDSGPPSKRASKRVSFIDEEAGQPLVQQESSPPEQIQEKQDSVEPVEDDKGTVEEPPAVKPFRKLHIPAIVVRQPSEEVDDIDSPGLGRRYPAQFDAPEVFTEEESPDFEAALPGNDVDDDLPSWDDLNDNFQDSTPEEIPDRSLIFPDLEDFLLNLDKDSPLDELPYSCESHVRDILRKSYGDEGPSGLGPVLNVPDEFLGMIRGSPQSHDGTRSDADQVDDVD